MQKTIVESMIKEVTIQDEFEKKLKASLSAQEKSSLQLAQQYAIKSNTLELDRELSGLTKDAQKPLEDALTEAGNRLAYEREYGELLSKGINPELAKQFVELDRIAAAAKTNLELQIATLQARAAELPVASEIRKELERQIELRKQQLNLIPGTVTETKGIMTATETKAKRTPEQDITAKIKTLKDEITDLTSVGQVAITSADNIGNAFGSAFSGLVSGAMTAKEALAGFFKDIAAGFLEMAAQIIAKQLTMIVLQTILKALGAVAGNFSGGTSSAVDTGAGGWANSFATELPGLSGDIGRTPLGFAKGGAFDNGIQPFANGGIVTRPTFFKFADGGTVGSSDQIPFQRGVMGEAGPEAIIPLKRGANGKLGVQAFANGGGSGSRESFGQLSAASIPFTKTTDRMMEERSERETVDAINNPKPLDVRFESQVINGVEYVTAEQHRKGMTQAAERGRALTLSALQNSVKTRKKVGMA
jgi:hypothetical protein